MEKAKVYFTKELTPEAMERMYLVLGSGLSGETAVKVHSGEMGNQNFIRPDFMKKVIEAVNGTVVECNTAYEGKRNTTKDHWETMKAHGWTEHFRVDIMDEDGELELPVEGGKQISVNYVGKNLQNYDSILVLSHFKGHPMGGFGGGVGVSKSINGGFGMVLDGSDRVDQILKMSMPWDVMVGVARRSWARNENALTTAAEYNKLYEGQDHITLPYVADDAVVESAVKTMKG